MRQKRTEAERLTLVVALLRAREAAVAVKLCPAIGFVSVQGWKLTSEVHWI
jgi:hypothetical protein